MLVEIRISIKQRRWLAEKQDQVEKLISFQDGELTKNKQPLNFMVNIENLKNGDAMLRFGKTGKGFGFFEAEKYQNEQGVYTRIVQESSALGDYEDSLSKPGSSFLWVGNDHHLNREEVKDLVGILNHWLDHGKLSDK
jgi:hypothetical protein